MVLASDLPRIEDYRLMYLPHLRRSLEAKAALYERLSRGEGLKELNQEEEEREGEGEAPIYMVDFTKKVHEVSIYLMYCS